MNLINLVLARIGMKITPSIDHLALYPAKIVALSGQSAVDVVPNDRRIAGEGGLTGVPMRLGLPGVTVTVQAGDVVLIGWEGGDPRYPYVAEWLPASNAPTKIVITGATVYLGQEVDADGVATQKDLKVLYAALNAAGTSPNDGGATYKSGVLLALTTAGWTGSPTDADGQQGSATVKAKR